MLVLNNVMTASIISFALSVKVGSIFSQDPVEKIVQKEHSHQIVNVFLVAVNVKPAQLDLIIVSHVLQD